MNSLICAVVANLAWSNDPETLQNRLKPFSVFVVAQYHFEVVDTIESRCKFPEGFHLVKNSQNYP